MADKEIKVTFGGGFKVDADYGGLIIRTDQPVRDGGEGTAPAPFDLFLASIATCAGYYALAFCKGRGIPTEGLGVLLRLKKDPGSKMISKIDIRVDLPPGFPPKYQEAIIKAVDACTVKAHLRKPPEFDTVAVPHG
jgi:putative redox protein